MSHDTQDYLLHPLDSHVWHGAFLRVPWLIPMCEITHSYAWLVSFLCVINFILICDMPHSYVLQRVAVCCNVLQCAAVCWFVSFLCLQSLITTFDMTCVWHNTFLCVTWHIPRKQTSECQLDATTPSPTPHTSISMHDTTHSYVWRNAFLHVICLIPMRGVTHSYVSHISIFDTFLCVTCLPPMCDMTSST